MVSNSLRLRYHLMTLSHERVSELVKASERANNLAQVKKNQSERTDGLAYHLLFSDRFKL